MVKPMRENDPANETRGGALRAGDDGFSLVEVLIAAGITAAILISISGMFVYGAQKVKAGRYLSAGTTVSQSILEEMRGLSAVTIYGVLDGQPVDKVKTWNSDQANPVYSGINQDFADKYGEILDGWRGLVREEIPRGQVQLTVEGFADRPQGGVDGSTTFGSARFLRIEVTVFWRESRSRGRRVTQQLIKF